jgi:hypothetical protein
MIHFSLVNLQPEPHFEQIILDNLILLRKQFFNIPIDTDIAIRQPKKRQSIAQNLKSSFRTDSPIPFLLREPYQAVTCQLGRIA